VNAAPKPSKRKLVAFGILLGAALSLILGEIIFRIIEPKSPPGTTYGVLIEENADGLRDRSYDQPKPAGVYHIFTLGDSFTWGVGLSPEETSPKLLEAALNAAGAGAVEVVNAAIPGYNSVEQWILLEDTGLAYQPDMVLVIFNMNDIEYKPELAAESYGEAEAVPVVEIDPGEDVTQFSRNAGLRGFVLELERRSALVRYLVPRVGAWLRAAGILDSAEFSWVEKIFEGFVDSNPGWLEVQRAFAEMKTLADENGFELVVAIFPLLNELDNYGGAEAHAALAGMCAGLQIVCVDLLPVFEGLDEHDLWINYADSHPNAAAQQMAADALFPAVLAVMEGGQ
jgi:hypothetical protein